MYKCLGLVLVVLMVSACSSAITLSDAGQQIRTDWNHTAKSCERLAYVTVSVEERGLVSRTDIKIRDELEVMARNEAALLGANTVRPLEEPHAGTQRWGAYQCQQPAGSRSVRASEKGAQAYPVTD